MDLARSPAIQYPLAALKHRTALDHPLAQAAGLLIILRIFIEGCYRKSPHARNWVFQLK